MKFIKGISLISLLLACVSLSAPALADNKGESKERVREVEGDHRRMALSIPGLGSATVVVTPAKQNVEKKAKPRTITVEVPDSVDDAIKFGNSACRQAGNLTSSGLKQAGQFATWVGVLLKQWSKQFTSFSPVATPAGSPYVSESKDLGQAANQKLYVTREGRLKTVVSR